MNSYGMWTFGETRQHRRKERAPRLRRGDPAAALIEAAEEGVRTAEQVAADAPVYRWRGGNELVRFDWGHVNGTLLGKAVRADIGVPTGVRVTVSKMRHPNRPAWHWVVSYPNESMRLGFADTQESARLTAERAAVLGELPLGWTQEPPVRAPVYTMRGRPMEVVWDLKGRTERGSVVDPFTGKGVQGTGNLSVYPSSDPDTWYWEVRVKDGFLEGSERTIVDARRTAEAAMAALFVGAPPKRHRNLPGPDAPVAKVAPVPAPRQPIERSTQTRQAKRSKTPTPAASEFDVEWAQTGPGEWQALVYQNDALVDVTLAVLPSEGRSELPWLWGVFYAEGTQRFGEAETPESAAQKAEAALLRGAPPKPKKKAVRTKTPVAARAKTPPPPPRRAKTPSPPPLRRVKTPPPPVEEAIEDELPEIDADLLVPVDDVVIALKWGKSKKGLRAVVWDTYSGDNLDWDIRVVPKRGGWVYSIAAPGADAVSSEAPSADAAMLEAENWFMGLITGWHPEHQVIPEPEPEPVLVPQRMPSQKGKRRLPDDAFKGAARPPAAEPFVSEFATAVGTVVGQNVNKKIGNLKLQDIYALSLGPELPVDIGMGFGKGEAALVFWPGELQGGGLLMAVVYYYHQDPDSPPTYEAKAIFDVSDLRVAYRLEPVVSLPKVNEIASWVISEIKKSA